MKAEITKEIAEKMYNSGDEGLKEFALLNYPELEKEDKLHLEVSRHGTLCIMFKDETIGGIDSDGRCFILRDHRMVKAYEQWRDSGMKTDDSVVEWRGGRYRLKKVEDDVLLRRNDVL